MKHGKINFDSLRAFKSALLVGFTAMCFSAMASDYGVQHQERDSNQVFIDYEQMPQFPGGETALMKYLQENIVYPPEAVKDSVQGKVVVKFIIDHSGNVSEVEVVRSVNELLDKEAVRVVKTLPRFAPGRLNGKVISVWYTLPVTFKLANDNKPVKPKDVEVKAEFPGGEEALLQFLKDHIKYPLKAAKRKIQGRVKVEFLVDKTGKVRDVKVVESMDKELDKEAVRVCKLLPDFIPATVNGKPVDVWFTLPVRFKIPDVKHQYIKTVEINAS